MYRQKRVVAVAGLALAALLGAAPACLIPHIRPWPPPPIPPPRPAPPAPEPMTTRLHKADIRIEENVAKVEVQATFYNPNGYRVEGTYFFPRRGLVERPVGYYVTGTRMGIESGPRSRRALEIESTFRMLKIKRLAGS